MTFLAARRCPGPAGSVPGPHSQASCCLACSLSGGGPGSEILPGGHLPARHSSSVSLSKLPGTERKAAPAPGPRLSSPRGRRRAGRQTCSPPVRRVGRVWGKYYPVYSGISLSLVTHHSHLLVTLDPALPKSQFQGFKRHGPGHMTSFRVCISLLGSLCP